MTSGRWTGRGEDYPSSYSVEPVSGVLCPPGCACEGAAFSVTHTCCRTRPTRHVREVARRGAHERSAVNTIKSSAECSAHSFLMARGVRGQKAAATHAAPRHTQRDSSRPGESPPQSAFNTRISSETMAQHCTYLILFGYNSIQPWDGLSLNRFPARLCVNT